MMAARGPPLWDRVDAPVGQADPPGEPVPEYEFDQRVSWWPLFPRTPVGGKLRRCPNP